VSAGLLTTLRVSRIVIEAQFVTTLLGDAALGDENSLDLE
jgi:hypothetical protein